MLIDSRVAGNFMDHNTIMKLSITMQPLQHPLKICAIDGGPIEDRPAILCIKHLLLHVRTLHQEHISFHITITVKHPLILGFPWMHLHDPQILSYEKEIMTWSFHCHKHCLQLPHLILASTTVERPEAQYQIDIPTEYHEFQEVFSKAKASGLRHHRTYDYAIELLSSTATRLHTSFHLSCICWILLCGKKEGDFIHV